MNETLPTSKDLEKLPLRAIVAYAARTARRVSTALRGLIPDEVLDNVLDRTDQVFQTPFLSDIDLSSLSYAVADLYGALSKTRNAGDGHVAGLCISRSATVAKELVGIGLDPWRANSHVCRVANKAELAVSTIDVLYKGATEAIAAANRDYEILLNTYGVHEQAIIGDPVDCFVDENNEDY
jgi:hypothetical protein